MQRYFYWMQDEDKEQDVENAKKVHNCLNNIKEDGKAKDADAAPEATGPEMSA